MKNPPFKDMARPKKESPDLMDERNADMFAEYERLIRAEGEKAKDLSKSYFYRETAKKFYITEARARVVIQKMLQMKSQPNRCQSVN